MAVNSTSPEEDFLLFPDITTAEMEPEELLLQQIAAQEKAAASKISHSDIESDSEEELYNRGLRRMTEEEYILYWQDVNSSDGFDVRDFPHVLMCSQIKPVNLKGCKADRKLAARGSRLAIKKYNKQQNANFQFLEVVKMNSQYASGFNYYITFKAKDKNIVRGGVKIFQTILFHAPGHDGPDIVELCRLKPAAPTLNLMPYRIKPGCMSEKERRVFAALGVDGVSAVGGVSTSETN